MGQKMELLASLRDKWGAIVSLSTHGCQLQPTETRHPLLSWAGRVALLYLVLGTDKNQGLTYCAAQQGSLSDFKRKMFKCLP